MFRSVLLFLRHQFVIPASILGILVLIFSMSMWFPAVAWVFGMEKTEKKVSLLTQAVIWSAKVKLNHSSMELPDEVVFGDVRGINEEGMLTLVVPEDKKYVLKKYVIGNVRILDRMALAQYTKSMINRSVRLDMYKGSAVVWDQDRMLNIDLIQKKVAEPMVKPPTPAYYVIFAEYLWRSYDSL